MINKKSAEHLPKGALVEQKEMFRIIFENSPSAITVTDAHECIVAWNHMAEKMFEMGQKDLFNKPVKELYSEQEWARIRSMGIREKGMLSDIVTKIIRRDGTVLDVNASISVLKDGAGKIIGSIGILYDISKQKLVEQELVQAKLTQRKLITLRVYSWPKCRTKCVRR